jgi:hypothetical protein
MARASLCPQAEDAYLGDHRARAIAQVATRFRASTDVPWPRGAAIPIGAAASDEGHVRARDMMRVTTTDVGDREWRHEACNPAVCGSRTCHRCVRVLKRLVERCGVPVHHDTAAVHGGDADHEREGAEGAER